MVDVVVPDSHMLRCRIEKCKELVTVVITCLWREFKKKKRILCWQVDFFTKKGAYPVFSDSFFQKNKYVLKYAKKALATPQIFVCGTALKEFGFLH